jgi:GTP-binding protein
MVEYERRVYSDLKYLSYAPILFISALTGQRVKKVLDVVDHVAEQAKKKIPTSQLNKCLGQWVENFPPPLHRNRRVKLNYITQVSITPPTFAIYTNSPDGIHFSYERFLINQIREAFGYEGVPIRLKFRKKRKEP